MQATIRGVAKSRARLSDFTSLHVINIVHTYLGVYMSFLTYNYNFFPSRIDECSKHVRFFLTPTAKLLGRRQWHPTPVLLPGKSHGRRSLVGCTWGRFLHMTSLSLFTFMHWRRKWQPTPVFLPGESQEQGSLMGCRLRGRTESDTTEVT